MHVVEAKYNSKLHRMMVLLANITAEEWDQQGRDPNAIKPCAYMYMDVTPEQWMAFKNAEMGTATDVHWECYFSGKHGEVDVHPIQYLMASSV